MPNNNKKFAIVGIGPRGLYATEKLLSKLDTNTTDKQIKLLLFEESGNFGNGQVYDIHQVVTNWINITERILHLDKRASITLRGIKIPGFPSYHEWANISVEQIPKTVPDNYPPRAKIGRYLKQRFESLIDPLIQNKIASLHKETVKEVQVLENEKISLTTDYNIYEDIDDLLLTIGHQPTEVSKQIAEWEAYFKDNASVHLFKDPYPVKTYLNFEGLYEKSSIGIRGFGLAMIDVVRGISSKFGSFKITDEATQQCEYHSVQNISKMFVPFSLDGLPPVPKPLNAEIDSLYRPTDSQINEFESIIGNRETQKQAESTLFLIEAIVPIIAKTYTQLPHHLNDEKLSLPQIEKLVHTWLDDNSFEHKIIASQKIPVLQMMQDFVGMATESSPVSLDFCIGQVWRHCQPSIYKQLSHNACSEEVFAQVIKLDEQLKRYSYGPPVESIQQMIALVSAGVMTLQFANDPDIELSEKGWLLTSKQEKVTVDIIINSVVDSPQIRAVNSNIVKNLLSNDLIKVVHDDFGVLTTENGYLIPKSGDKTLPIALLGRLAKGTIIGVDAILECFGNRPEDWADKASSFR